jgi:hypothetical protein
MQRNIIFVAVAFWLVSAAAAAATPDFADMTYSQVRAEIKARCLNEMADAGSSLQLTCMKMDWRAAQTVRQQLTAHPTLAKRCLHQMRDAGYTLVATCIRQDTQAQSKIDDW